VGVFLDPSQDLVHLDLQYDSSISNFRLNATRVIEEFIHPVDAVIDSNKIYVIETGNSNTSGLFEIILPVPQFDCNPILSINILAPCDPDSNTVIIPSFGLLPNAINWYDSLGNLLQADTGLTAADTLFDLPSGGYYSIITDGGACISDTIAYSIPDSLSITIDSVQHTTCIGCSDAEIFYAIKGGLGPYQVSVPTTGLTAGFYNICVLDANSCQSCDTVTILDAPVKVLETTQEYNIIMYPNPASDFVSIEISDYDNAKVVFSLFEMNGKQVDLIIHKNEMSSTLKSTFGFSKIPEGSYIMQIKIGEKIIHKKLVVIKE
jgi:hypothetical protein